MAPGPFLDVEPYRGHIYMSRETRDIGVHVLEPGWNAAYHDACNL